MPGSHVLDSNFVPIPRFHALPSDCGPIDPSQERRLQRSQRLVVSGSVSGSQYLDAFVGYACRVTDGARVVGDERTVRRVVVQALVHAGLPKRPDCAIPRGRRYRPADVRLRNSSFAGPSLSRRHPPCFPSLSVVALP